MACKNYRVIQLTNSALGAVSANTLMPLGSVTRKISGQQNSGPVPFEVTTSGADTVQITRKGYYKIMYTCSLQAAAAGVATINLLVGGQKAATAQNNVASGATVNLTLIFDTRVFANCAGLPTNCPLPVQIQLGDVAITSGTGNLIIDSCVNG